MTMKKPDHTAEILKLLPVFLAGISFVIGTVLFVLFLMSKQKEIYVELIFYYIMLAILVNGIAFFGVIVSSFFFKAQRSRIFKRAFVLLINIPVVFAYLFIYIQFN